MLEALFAFLVGQSPTLATLVIGSIIMYQQRDIRRSIRVLNHNSSTVVKALLAHKLLKPEDVKDIEV